MHRIFVAFVIALAVAGCELQPAKLAPSEVISREEFAAWSRAAYSPGRAEAVEHRLTDLRPIVVRPRIDSPLGPFAGFYLAVTVNQDGRVSDARVLQSGAALHIASKAEAKAALAQARSLRFAPFVRDGRPVTAHVGVNIPMVERLVPPPPSKSFPNGDLSSARIELTRTRCFGSCPAYTVAIDGTGAVTWQGDAFVAVKGQTSDRVDPAIVAQLLQRAKAASFFDLRDVYRADVTDSATFTVTITFGGKVKKVEDYDGSLVGMPYEVTMLEQAIDRAAGTARWIGPDQDPD